MQPATLENENPDELMNALGECLRFGLNCGAIWGAVFGAIYGFIVGALPGVVLGAFGGAVAALIACIIGGRTGIILGGIIGGFAAWPPINPINIYCGGEPPRYFWQAVLMSVPMLLGGIAGVYICLEAPLSRQNGKKITRVRDHILRGAIAKWHTLDRWVLRLILLVLLTISGYLTFVSSGYPKHRVLEYLALQELSGELARQPNAAVVETERFTFRRSDATLQENGKKEKWRRVSPQAIQKVAAQDGATISDLRKFGAISPYYQSEKSKKPK